MHPEGQNLPLWSRRGQIHTVWSGETISGQVMIDKVILQESSRLKGFLVQFALRLHLPPNILAYRMSLGLKRLWEVEHMVVEV